MSFVSKKCVTNTYKSNTTELQPQYSTHVLFNDRSGHAWKEIYNWIIKSFYILSAFIMKFIDCYVIFMLWWRLKNRLYGRLYCHDRRIRRTVQYSYTECKHINTEETDYSVCSKTPPLVSSTPKMILNSILLDDVTKRRNRYLEISRDSIEGKKNGRQHGKNVAKAVSQKVQYF